MDSLIMLAMLAATMQEQPAQSAEQRDNREILTTVLAVPAGAVDSNQSPELKAVMGLIQAKDFATAKTRIKPLLERCQAQEADPKRRIVNFSDQDEFLYFSSTAATSGQVVSWVRDDCAVAYKTQAFMAVEAGDAEDAFRYLDLATRRAPCWAQVYTERAFLLMRMGRSDDALAGC